MTKPFTIRPIPPNFGDRFPDGDYTVGPGADPRGRHAEAKPEDAVATAPVRKPKKHVERTRKPVRPAAE